MNTEKVITTIKGVSGIGGIELLDISIPTGGDIEQVIKICIQIVIGLITIVGIFKKKREK